MHIIPTISIIIACNWYKPDCPCRWCSLCSVLGWSEWSVTQSIIQWTEIPGQHTIISTFHECIPIPLVKVRGMCVGWGRRMGGFPSKDTMFSSSPCQTRAPTSMTMIVGKYHQWCRPRNYGYHVYITNIKNKSWNGSNLEYVKMCAILLPFLIEIYAMSSLGGKLYPEK